MERLSQAMHAATADPPPSSIDIDQLIVGERRHARDRYRVRAAAGVAVLVAGAVLVPLGLYGRGSGTGLTVAPNDCPTEFSPQDPMPESSRMTSGPTVEVSRPPVETSPTFGTPPTDCHTLAGLLDAALTRAVHRFLPDAELVNANVAERPGLFHLDTDRGYLVYVRFGESVLRVQVGASDAYTRGLCWWGGQTGGGVPADRMATPCVQTTVPGAHLIAGATPDKRDATIDFVSIAKQDGTEVRLMLSTDIQSYDPPYPALPMTVDQLTTIGLDPGLTLFP